MSVVDKFNGLNGAKVTRKEVKSIILLAHAEEQTEIVERLAKLAQSKGGLFEFKINDPAIEVVPASFLHCLDYQQDADNKIIGLGKAVTPNEVYQIITDRMIQLIQTVNKGYVKEWEAKTYGTGYLIPFNFVTKKAYRGVNRFLLTGLKPLKNPFFLTFNQVDDLKGKVRKGAKGHEVVYFTHLYRYVDSKQGINVASYDKKKFIAMVEPLRNKIPRLQSMSIDNFARLQALPILKYYKVFNGADIEGIDFKLESFKHGYIEKELPATEANRLPVADAIISNYPTPQPKLAHGGNRAFYRPGSDSVQMPHFADFTSAQAYYRTLFHEFAHSTGNTSRMARDFSGSFGSKPYAFEELVAEFGATFLSAEAGILWHTNSNHAAYLKSWNNVLTHLKEDNRFLMRAATQAQAAADFILQYDDKGDPAYFKDIKPAESKPKAKRVQVAKPKNTGTKKTVPGKKQLEEINPKPYEVKPKSVSVATAIGEVLATGKYPGLKPTQVNVLFNVLKNVEDITQEVEIETGEFQEKMLLSIPERYVYYFDWGDTLELQSEGVKLINAIRGRIDSLKKQKTNYAMFPLNAKRKGLNAPAEQVPVTETTGVEQPQPVAEASANFRPGSVAHRRQQRANQVREYYKIDNPELKRFLGDIEIKEKESVVITVASEQGGGKSRFLFQCIEAFGKNYKPGHASMEEHPDSSLYEDKVNQYLSAQVESRLVSPEINSYTDFEKLIEENEIIFVDSWAKLMELQPKIMLDKDLRKKYDGKLFIIIYQLTSDGKMRGGSSSQFDGDIILLGEKSSDYRENKIVTNKNRYNDIPACDLKFNVFTGKCLAPVPEEKLETQPQPLNAPAKPGLLFATV